MARIEGVPVPGSKRSEIGLTYIYGVGPHLSKQILKEAEIDPDIRVEDLSQEQIALLSQTIRRMKLSVEGDLRKDIKQNIDRLRQIKSYRGSRHARSLPVRGQRTKTNARTRKGPRGNAIAKKKVATKK